MNFSSRTFCLLCVLYASAVSGFSLDREAFTLTNYDLQVRLEPEQQRLGVRGKITLRNDSAAPQKIVVLQISSSLGWKSITASGKTPQFILQAYTSDIDHTGALSEAIVTLPQEIAPRGTVELAIGYEGVIPLDATRLTRIGTPGDAAKSSDWDEISANFSAVRGVGYVAWYPIATESADFSEGNSLFEVVNRWKARAAGSEFKAKLTLSHETGERAPSLICTPSTGNLVEEMGRTQPAGAECTWAVLGTVAPTFAVARYHGDYKPPLNVLSLESHESGAATYLNAIEPATQFVTEWFGKPTAPIAIADFADPHAPRLRAELY